MQEVEQYGPLFEHWLGLKPWDLERYTTSQVQHRLAWVKTQLKSLERGDDVDVDRV